MVFLIPFLAVILFIVIIIQIFDKKKKSKKSKNKECCREYDISKGKLSIIFDAKKNVIIIPFNYNYMGKGKATALPLLISYPYLNEELGDKIKMAMELSKNTNLLTDADLMKSLGYNSWKLFSQGRKNISVHYDNGIVVNSTTRKPDGSYVFNKKGFEKVLDADVSNKFLGIEVLNALKNCY